MIAAYLRVSTDEQRERQTIEIQRQEILRYCQTKNLKVTRFYSDAGISGTVPIVERPDGRAMLEDAQRGAFRELLIYKLDRLGRDNLIILSGVAELKKRGVTVTSVTQPTEDDANGRLMVGILSAFSAHERDQIRERSMAGSRRLARDGVWLGGIAPYAYRQEGNDRESHLVISTDLIPGSNLSEADVVRRIYEQAAVGKSCPVICKYLTRLGVPAGYTGPKISGKRKHNRVATWTLCRVRSVLINPAYKGQLFYGKRHTTRDEEGKVHLTKSSEPAIVQTCPAIVDADLWERANAAMRANRIAATAHSKNQYLLTGLIRCGLCGHCYIGMAVTRPNGRKQFYYRCGGRHAFRGPAEQRCQAPSVPGAALEGYVWDRVAEFLMRPGLAIRELKAKMATESERGHRVEDEIRPLKLQLAKIPERRQEVLRLAGLKLFTDQEIREQVERTEAEKSEIEQRLAELGKVSAEAETCALQLDWAGRLLGDLHTKLCEGTLTFERKRQFVQTLVAGITVTRIEGKGTEIKVRFRFDSDFERTREWNPSLASHLALTNTGTRYLPAPPRTPGL